MQTLEKLLERPLTSAEWQALDRSVTENMILTSMEIIDSGAAYDLIPELEFPSYFFLRIGLCALYHNVNMKMALQMKVDGENLIDETSPSALKGSLMRIKNLYEINFFSQREKEILKKYICHIANRSWDEISYPNNHNGESDADAIEFARDLLDHWL